MSAAAVMSVQALSDNEQLDRARMLCTSIKTVWFKPVQQWDAKARALTTGYVIYRRGMGEVARRSTPAALVAYLREQLPVRP